MVACRLRLIEARGIFALRVEPWNPHVAPGTSRWPSPCRQPRPRVIARAIVDLLECDAPIGNLTVYGCPEIAEAPDRVHRSLLQVVGGRQADGCDTSC